jgi:MFS family permease
MATDVDGARLAATPEADAGAAGRWRQLALLSFVVLCALGTWFSAAAVAPTLSVEWRASGLAIAGLTIAVQLGFALGAVLLAAVGAPDVLPARTLMALGAATAAVTTAGFALFADSPLAAIPWRVLTGMGVAAVYPVGMKVLAGWFRRGRGLAVGTLIGAITIGSAMPHLLRAAGTLVALDWRSVVLASAAIALVGAAAALAGAREGPYNVPAPRFSAQVAAAALRERSVVLANFGYLGHMWELFAMWSWIPTYLVAALAATGMTSPGLASLGAFAVIASGGIGCVVAGALADRLGRTATTMGAMALSGSFAILTGLLFGAPAWLILASSLVWGITVVADSAQFSTAVSELAPPGTAGSALTLQTASGFLLTSVTIVAVGLLSPTDGSGWRVAFAILAVGPALGIWAMWRLRRRPEAARMANGHR